MGSPSRNVQYPPVCPKTGSTSPSLTVHLCLHTVPGNRECARLAVRPRYGAKQGARTLSDAARLVWERFGGDAGAIWKDASPAEVEKTLQEIHGLGAGIASMATRILRDDFGCFRGQERQIDVKPDVHLVRVFRRLGIIDGDSANEAIRTARRLNPEFPGELDWPAWWIGQKWCHPTEPDCARCPLTGDCAKRM